MNSRVVVAAALLGAILAGFMWVLLYRGLDAAAAVAGLVSAGPVLVALVGYARTSALRPAISTPSQVADAEKVLAGLVRAQWNDEAAIRGLYYPDPMAVHWQLTRDSTIMDLPRNIMGTKTLKFRAATDNMPALVEQFRQLRRRRLVIIGGPGAGKSTLALLLLLQLINYPVEGEPIPVMLSLGGWDPVNETFQAWLARRLSEDYPKIRGLPYGPTVINSITSQRRILPILDGLDELSEPDQSRVIDGLNDSMSEQDQLMLTSRTAEFAATAKVLTGAAVIEPEPLTSEAVADYIEACLPGFRRDSWNGLIAELRREPAGPVDAALAAPLNLWLFRQIYIEGNADALSLTDSTRFPTSEAVSAYLVRQFLPALISSELSDGRHSAGKRGDRARQARWDWSTSRPTRWLEYLAHHLSVLGTRDLTWWQLATAAPRWQVSLVSVFVAGVSGGLVSVLAATLTSIEWRPGNGLSTIGAATLTGSLVGTALFLLMAFFLAYFELLPRFAARKPSYVDRKLGESVESLARVARRQLAWGIAWGSVVGLSVCLALVDKYSEGPVVGIGAGLTVGAIIALVFSIARSLPERTQRSGRFTAPNLLVATLRLDRRVFAIRLLTNAFVGGLIIGIATGAWTGALKSVVVALIGASGFSLATLYNGMLRNAWIAYTYTRFLLAVRGQIPWRLVPFLEGAYKAGLFRRAGSAYQFRHASLQDQLAISFESDRSRVGSRRGDDV
jgi:NACHT domain